MKNDAVLIEPSVICIADENGKGFINPRRFHQGETPAGLDNENISRLASDISERGITNPLHCRKIDGKLQLIAGERRLTAANLLKLPLVPVYIYDELSDEDAWLVAWRDNDTPENIGENATASLVKHWRKEGFSDEQILKITNRTSQWLRQMDILSNLDEKCFDAYAQGLISLRIALQLAQVEDFDFRQKLLNETLSDVQQDHLEWLDKQKKTLKKAENRKDNAEAMLIAAEMMGTDEEQKEAKDNFEKANEEILEIEQKIAEQKVPQAKAKNLSRASKKVGGAEKLVSALSKVKIEKLLKKVETYIEDDGADGEEFVGEVEHLRLVKDILHNILVGNDNIKDIMTGYYNPDQVVKEIINDDDFFDDDDDFDE